MKITYPCPGTARIGDAEVSVAGSDNVYQVLIPDTKPFDGETIYRAEFLHVYRETNGDQYVTNTKYQGEDRKAHRHKVSRAWPGKPWECDCLAFKFLRQCIHALTVTGACALYGRQEHEITVKQRPADCRCNHFRTCPRCAAQLQETLAQQEQERRQRQETWAGYN